MFMQFIQQLGNGLILGSTYTLIALGLTMIYGILGIVNFAHGEIYMLGAFVGLFLSSLLHLPFLGTLALTILVMALFGVAVELVVFRPLRFAPTETNIIIGTLGLSIFLLNAAIVVWGPDPVRFATEYTDVQMTILGVSMTAQRLLVLIVSIVMILSLRVFIKRTKMGKAMRACSQDLEAASLMGIEINQVAIVTSGIAAALAGTAGTLVGPVFLVYPQMSLLAATKAFCVVILGGMGNVEGAIIGGFTLGIAETLAAGFFSSYWKEVVAFIVLIMVLIIKPEGMFGERIMEKI